MLLGEIERAQLHERETLPDDAVTIGSQVDFIDEKSAQVRRSRSFFPRWLTLARARFPS